MDLLLKNANIQTSHSNFRAHISVKNGLINEMINLENVVRLQEVEKLFKENAIIDLSGLLLLPGLIDSQVHFREPGLTHKEDICSGSKAAVLGGICTFFEMPNTNPSTTSVARVEEKLKIAEETSFANYGFYIGASAENLESLKEAEDLKGCCGVKIFLGSSTGDLLLYNQEKLLNIFQNIKMPIAVHSECEKRLTERKPIRDNAQSVHAHYEWRDATSALNSTKMILEIAKEAKRKVHILHISTKEEMSLLKENKDLCTVEATPQHSTLFAPDIYEKINTFAQMNPPIRTQDHRDGVFQGILDGTVDVLGSDHAPHTKEEKAKDYPNSPSGMPGVQTIFPVMLHHYNNGKISLEKIIELLSEAPAKLYGLNKGKVEVGFDADFTIIDPKKEWTIRNEDQASKAGWCAFDGLKVIGKPIITIVSGQIAMKDDKVYNIKAQPIERKI